MNGKGSSRAATGATFMHANRNFAPSVEINRRAESSQQKSRYFGSGFFDEFEDSRLNFLPIFRAEQKPALRR